MRFIYHQNAGDSSVLLEGEALHHIINVRRQKCAPGEVLAFANLTDSRLYDYNITHSAKHKITLNLADSRAVSQVLPATHLALGIFDMGEFYRILPALNELGVAQITLFYADFSQKNQRLNADRAQKILIQSCCQCARLSLMRLEVLENLAAVCEKYPGFIALDFEGKSGEIRAEIHAKIQGEIRSGGGKSGVIIGPEGGFSQKEREILKNRSLALNHPLVLRASTAAIFAAGALI